MMRIAFGLLLLIAVSSTRVNALEPTWQAGVAKVNITPELPIWLSGYASRDKPATSKHDDLWAKALVVEDAAGHRAALITMDLVGIDRELSVDVCRNIEAKFKLPRAAIALSASHTHSGPVLRGNLMPMFNLDADQTRRVTEYKEKLQNALVEVVGQAIDSLAPAQISWGIGEATFAVNRRNNSEPQVPKLRAENKLQGPVDHELPVLAVRGQDGALRAIVGGYACHATTLADFFITADWPGAGQNELERRHPGTIAMFVAGCGADQNPLPRRTLELMHNYGEQFANGVDKAIQFKLKPVAPKLATSYFEIDLPFDTLPTRAELELEAANDNKSQAPWARYLLSEWDRHGKLPTTYPYPVQAWKLGDDLTWIFLGGEVVVDYSLRFKSELSPGKTWVSAYMNDVMAYIPSRRVLAEGGYEGGTSRFPYGLPAVWAGSVEKLISEKVHELVEKGAPPK
jgi:hypothetical protein